MEIKILIADDDPIVHESLRIYLEAEGFAVADAYDGQEALDKLDAGHYSLCVLDVMMPKRSGTDVCREIRSKSELPVVLLTAKGEEVDRIVGLELGADDYIVKPFSPREVVARIRAILRRMENRDAGPMEKNVIRMNGLVIDLNSYKVLLRDESVLCTPKEIEILFLLASNPGQVFTRDMLLSRVWGYDFAGETRTVDTHIKRLRAKLPSEGLCWSIKTIYGVGYKVEIE
ncbi:MAG: response regulator transcription factor [Clostridiales bacterium]|nr:response regulator transcription factor [Clostridiales bacterium]